ncbi:MAG: DUF3846 domain-containing protein [Clostridiales bacterium]|nr:DUF3846 domain-containing protein [Clostridiales bacterium]
MNKETIRVLLVKPDEKAVMIEMEDSLDAMQETVGGMIEEYMPFEDEVAVVCNEEGKMTNLPPNRAIFDEKGEMQDIIAGPFFVCYAPIESEKFLSLTPELEAKYKEKFQFPEQFFRTPEGIKAMKFIPAADEKNAEQTR